jgi:hypothetical protein
MTVLRASFVLLLALPCLLPTASSPAASTATAAGACSIPHKGEHLGPTYLTSLSVSGTSCTTGLTVVRGYHNCQLKRGGVKGKCTSRVDGFLCSEKRGPSIPTEYFSSVSCRSGSKRVNYKYSQFT